MRHIFVDASCSNIEASRVTVVFFRQLFPHHRRFATRVIFLKTHHKHKKTSPRHKFLAHETVGGLLITYKLTTHKLITDKLITYKMITKIYKLITYK